MCKLNEREESLGNATTIAIINLEKLQLPSQGYYHVWGKGSWDPLPLPELLTTDRLFSWKEQSSPSMSNPLVSPECSTGYC